jgi:hypothetical protein
MRKQTQKRKAMNIWQILAGLGLAAVVGGVVGPRLMNSDLPGLKSNIKTEINSIHEMVDQYLANNGADATNIDFDQLKADGIMNGSLAANVASNVYKPAWAKGDVEFEIVPATGTDKSLVNVKVTILTTNGTFSNDTRNAIEGEVVSHAGVKFGSDAVDGSTANADASGSFASAAPISGGTAANDDGKVVFTIQ